MMNIFFHVFSTEKITNTHTYEKPTKKNNVHVCRFLRTACLQNNVFNMDKAQALPVQFRSFTLTGCPLEEQAHQVGFRCFRASKPPKASRGWYIELKLVEVNHCVGQTFPDVFESTSDRCF